MKKSTTILLCVGTAGVSSLVTYILTRRHFQKKLESLCLNCKEPRLEANTVTTAETNPLPSNQSDWDKEWQAAIEEQLRKRYIGTEELPTTESDDEPETEDESLEALDPYICTDEEFMTSEEKSYFTVYKDGVIADDKDKIIRNPAHYLGEDILKTLSSQGDDPLYVRNPVLNVAIEIGFSLEDYGA